MATLSHEAFRRAVARFGGCDEYFTEMIHAPSLVAGGKWEKFYLLDGPEPEKIVWQLTGSGAGPMARAAEILSGRGGIGIDLNMGCSAPQIASTGAGVAWMTKPLGETREMVRSVRKATAGRLSVKMRLGAEDWTEDGLLGFCRMLVDEGVQALTIHPRTRRDKFRGRPRWDVAEIIARAFPSVPVVLNGDVSDAASLSAATAAAPSCAGVMVARAAAAMPWIFRLLRSGGGFSVDLEEVALRFIDDVEECQPEEFHRTRLQRFFAYFSRNVSFAHYFAVQMCNAKNNEDARARVRDYFFRCSGDRMKVF